MNKLLDEGDSRLVVRKVRNIDLLCQHNSVDVLKDISVPGEGRAAIAGVVSQFLSGCLGNRHNAIIVRY